MKFICTGGPYGDECSSYNVIFNDSYKVREAINEILAQNEWGSIQLNYKDIQFKIDYKGNKLLNEIAPYIFEADIIECHAYGGWSLMDYIFTITNVNLPKKYYNPNVEPFIDF